MSMLRGFLGLRQLAYSQKNVFQALCGTQYSSSVAAEAKQQGDVPEGHAASDLSNFACHIGLGRRRDLTLRQDLRLWNGQAEVALADVFKGKKVMLIGMPGGKVCSELHFPSYLREADQLRARGVDKVVAILISEPADVQQVLPDAPLQQDGQVCVYADRNGGFIRLLGLDLGGAESSPKCQRFAAILEDGILLKLAVEQSPADLKVTDARSMMQLWDKVYKK